MRYITVKKPIEIAVRRAPPRKTVGNTPLSKYIELCRGGATVRVKDESRNMFGTFKDRRCVERLKTTAEPRELVFVQITAGNSGYSMGMLANVFEMGAEKKRTVVNIVPKGLPEVIRRELEKCSIVVEEDLNAEILTQDRIRAIARAVTGFSGPDDCILGVEDYGLTHGYRDIVAEIREQGVKPTHIFCPAGEGELAVVLAEACKIAWGDEAPKVVAVTIGQNTLATKDDFLKKLRRSVADKLMNHYSKFKSRLLELVGENRAELITIRSEDEIARKYQFLNKIGIDAEPSAAVAFCGLDHYKFKPGDEVVVVNTGKGIFDPSAVEKTRGQIMRKVFRYAAVLALGAGIALGGYFGYLGYKRYEFRRDVDKTMARLNLEDKAALWAKSAYGSWALSPGDELRMCLTIPDLNCKDREHLRVSDLTDRQLRFFIEVQRISMDNWSRTVIPGMRKKYLSDPESYTKD